MPASFDCWLKSFMLLMLMSSGDYFARVFSTEQLILLGIAAIPSGLSTTTSPDNLTTWFLQLKYHPSEPSSLLTTPFKSHWRTGVPPEYKVTRYSPPVIDVPVLLRELPRLAQPVMVIIRLKSIIEIQAFFIFLFGNYRSFKLRTWIAL